MRGHKPELIAYLRPERLADLAADELRKDPALQRAVKGEPDGDKYVLGVAVRMSKDGIATTIATLPPIENIDLLGALDRACREPLQ